MILDTSFCVDLIRETAHGETGRARTKLASLQDTEMCISLFTLCELSAGVELSRNPERERRKVEQMATFVTILYPDEVFALLYGEGEAYLRKRGIPIPVMDLLIGITALSARMPLLTRDVEHYDRIPGLSIETY
jgi:tRNA(fMet)-specific endonuclease VapC